MDITLPENVLVLPEIATCQPQAVDSAATAYFPSGFDGFAEGITFLPQPKNNNDY